MKRRNAYKLLDIASLVIVVLVGFIIAMFLYIRFWPVDVLKNQTWVLCTAPLTNHKCETGVPEFHINDTIPVYINSDKVRNVGGTFTTSAECKNKAGVFVSYPISESHVNRAKGHVETEIDTKIPEKIPTLPTTCRIAYVLEYSVYSFRSFSEYNFSNDFTLLEAVPVTQEPQTSNNTSISYFAPQTNTVTPPQTSPSGSGGSQTPDTSGQPSQAPAPPPQQNIVQRAGGAIMNIVHKIGNLL